MNINSLSAAGFDYVAMGHIHRPQILLRDRAAYAGALEPIDRGHLGEHGNIEATEEIGRQRVSIVRFPS